MMNSFKKSRHRATRRPGVILPIVLGCLLVVALIGSALARTMLVHRRAARHAEHTQQAAWLADSALLRAQAKLAGNAAYSGETWQVGADELQAGYSGIATIRIEPLDDGHQIVIEATYPEHAVHRTLQRREKHLKSSSPGGS